MRFESFISLPQCNKDHPHSDQPQPHVQHQVEEEAVLVGVSVWDRSMME